MNENGLCGAPFKDVTRFSVLYCCPYTIIENDVKVITDFNHREVFKLPVSSDDVLKHICPTCPLANIEKTENELYDETLAYVKLCIPSEPLEYQKFLADEAYASLPDVCPVGKDWVSLILASIFLASKCPANSEKPLTTGQIAKSVKFFSFLSDKYNLLKSIRRGARKLRTQGKYAPVCLVSATQIIYSLKEELSKYLSDTNISVIIEYSKKLDKNKHYIRYRQGKSPSTLAGAIIYAVIKHKNLDQGAITQTLLGDLTNNTDVSIRRNYVKILKILQKEGFSVES